MNSCHERHIIRVGEGWCTEILSKVMVLNLRQHVRKVKRAIFPEIDAAFEWLVLLG